jgi:ABC-2 type transport system ATP-binding protein
VKRYGSVDAANGLSLSLPKGAIYPPVGHNGSGKTTTIRMLLDLSLPDAGTARALGMDCHADRMKVRSG